MPASYLFAGRFCFRYPFCLIDIAGLHFEMSFVQGSAWCLAIILARCLYILLCLRVHDVFPLAFNRSSVLGGCAHYVVNPWLQFNFLIFLRFVVEGGVAVGVLAADFLFVGILRVGLSRVLPQFTSWVV